MDLYRSVDINTPMLQVEKLRQRENVTVAKKMITFLSYLQRTKGKSLQ